MTGARAPGASEGAAPPSREVVPEWAAAPDGPGAGPRFVVRREYFGALVYDRETLTYVPYDAGAAALLLARLPGAPPPRPPTGDEAAFLAGLAAEGLLDGDGRLRARLVDDRAAPDRLSAPLTCYLGATAGCNLACGHCQAGSAPGPLGALPLPLARRLFDELRGLGCGLVHVTGGEPMLHPDFLPALDLALERGLNVLLTTNGTLVTDALAEALAARALRCVSVSLDGPTPAIHDAVRGEGALARALEGLARLARRRPTGVTATLTPALVPALADLVALCERAGAASLTLRPALPAGRAAARPDLLPSYEEFLRAIDALDRLQARASIPLFHPPPVPHEATTAHVLERFGCVAGNLVCSVGPTGQVSPCALLGPEFDAGDLAGTTLHALWAAGPSFARLRALEGTEACWSCRHYDRCGGGCRARALAAGRGLDDPDPWCAWAPRDEVARAETPAGEGPRPLPLAPAGGRAGDRAP